MSSSVRDAIPADRSSTRRARPRGQILIIYVMAIFVFIGMLAIVVDISWYWINSNRIQKAADAAALAGVVWLPGDEGKAKQTAIYEAAKNGYTVTTSGVPLNGVTVTAAKAGGNDRRLNVTINAPVGTFFMRVFGLPTIPASRSARAEYVLPVAMGSPENYYGVFGPVRDATMTTTTTQPPTDSTGANTPTSARAPTQALTGANWASTQGSLANSLNSGADNRFAQTSTANAVQQWGTFGLATTGGSSPIPNAVTTNPTTSINIIGIVVNVNDTFLSATCANSKVGVRLNWNAGAASAWSTQVATSNLGTNTTNGDYPLPSAAIPTNTTAWGSHAWVRGDFTDAKFVVELQALKGCSTSGIRFNVDQVQVTVYYTITTHTIHSPVTTTTSPADYPLTGPGAPCTNGQSQCFQSTPAGGGKDLNARGFWATMNTEGAGNVNGDAFQPYYDDGNTVAPVCPTSTLRACYDPTNYYNYAIEMPPNSSGGYVYIFDPVFCSTDLAKGTGERWFDGSNHNPISSYFELWDTGTNLFSQADDTQIVSSSTKFESMAYTDQSMDNNRDNQDMPDCRQKATSYGDARDYHDSWYLLNPSNPLTGGANGTIYRVHTTGTNPTNVAQQRNANAQQSFAIYASATAPGGVQPKVYGIGAMQMVTPLSSTSTTASVTSELYLAQIDPIHAGKTLELHLWDPGDTTPLIADIAVLTPTSTTNVWTPTSMSYTAKVGTSGSRPNPACNGNTGTGVTSIRTSSGATIGNFNGCWLTIDILIPTDYVGYQGGWWKIRYTMRNTTSGEDTSSDVTTWTAEIQGNPVHLVAP